MSDDPPRKKRPRPPTPEEMAAERVSGRRNGYIAFAVLCVLMPTLFVINLIRTRMRHDEEMGLTPTAPMKASEPTDKKRVLDNEEDLVIVPAVVKPSRHDVAFSIGAILGDTKPCFKEGAQSVQATWQVHGDGSASDIQRVPSNAYESGHADDAFTCVAAAVKQAHVAPFDGSPVRVTYTFRSAPLSPGPR